MPCEDWNYVATRQGMQKNVGKPPEARRDMEQIFLDSPQKEPGLPTDTLILNV